MYAYKLLANTSNQKSNALVARSIVHTLHVIPQRASCLSNREIVRMKITLDNSSRSDGFQRITRIIFREIYHDVHYLF